MRKFRKLLAVLLTVVLTFGNSVSVFAGEIDLPVETETVEAEFGEAESEEEFLESETLETQETQEVNEEEATDEAGEVLPDEEEIPLEIQSEEGLDVIAETAEETEESENEEIIDEEIEGSYPGVDLEGFCEDSEIIEDKEELGEYVDEILQGIPDEDYVEGEIIVAAPDEETAELYAEGFGGELGAYLEGYCLILLDPYDENDDGYGLTVADAVLASADLESALPAAYPNYMGELLEDESEENELDKIEYNINDFSSMYNDPGLKGENALFQYQHSLMQSDAAWRAGYTGAGIKVAVIDTGAYEKHEDLKLTGKGSYNYSTKKFSNVASDTLLTDPDGHGTHCCGTVAAIADNSKGGAGIAPGASLYAARIADDNGQFDEWSVYSAIIFATSTWKVDVMSISLRIGATTPNAKEIESAVEKAYKAGIAVFVASGNDCSNILQYPSRCEHAIAVGAVNAGNVATEFTNINSHVRYSGPGYNIISTYKGSTSAYESLDGTSMACPAVAGAAAVILSSGIINGSGSAKVDNLLAFMDSCTTKSGIGKGTPNLAKAFGLPDLSATPSVPTASPVSRTITSSSVSVTLKSNPGTTIYYDKNGGNISVKNGIISSNAIKYTGPFTLNASAGAKHVIKAVAVNDNTKLSSKQVSFTYTFKPKVSSVSIGSKALDFIVTRGASLQLTAAVIPTCAANKTVKWSIPVAKTGVSINEKTGKLTVDKNTTATSVTVRATAADGSEKYKEERITIVSKQKIKSVKAQKSSLTVYSGESDIVYITTLDLNGNKVDDNSKYLGCSSSKTGIAEATINSEYVQIKGTAPGKTVLSFYSKDGAYKKASITVNVLQKVNKITLSKSSVNIVQGGSYTPSVTVTPSNASNKKVKWSLCSVPSGTVIKTCGVSVNSGSGKVSVSSKAQEGVYTIKCDAVDKQNASAFLYITVKKASGKITKLNFADSSITLFRITNTKGAKTGTTVTATVTPSTAKSYLEILSNSAPKIVSAEILEDSPGKISIKATGNATGTATITVATTDGTNIKKTIKVKVINPPSGMALSLPKGRSEILGYGKSMKITPIIYTENGPIDASSKKLVWSSNKSYVKVSSNGTVKMTSYLAVSSESYYTVITAKTTDGSGIQASIVIKPNAAISGLKAYNYGGYITADNNGNPHVGRADITIVGGRGVYGCFVPMAFTVKGPEDGCVVLTNDKQSYFFYFRKKGTYTATFYTTDGSNKKVTCRWNAKW